MPATMADNIRGALMREMSQTYPYSFYLKRDGKIKHVFGSGLLIMSRYPFKVLDKVYFKKCGDFDCFAAKGSVVIETTLPSGKVVQFAPTHLQAKAPYGKVRISQLNQIKQMLKKYERPEVPQIVLGDLNIDVVEPEFAEGLQIMDMEPMQLVGPIKSTNGRTTDCYQAAGSNKQWIDHFWISQNTYNNRSTMEVRDLEFQYNGKICPSSDHHAIEARIFF